MTTSKNNKTFTWNVRAIDIERGGKYAAVPSIIAHLDILGAPGSTASTMDLHVDLQNRLSGKPATIPEIKNVIFNPPATIVLWSDNTKTVVKCQEGDTYDPEHGLAMAIVKKMYGNTGKYCEIFKKWIKEEENVPCDDPNITLNFNNVNFKEALEKLKKAAVNPVHINLGTAKIFSKALNDFAEKEAAKTLADKLEKETGWIATTHKLPSESGDYLVYDLFTGSSYVYEYDKTSVNDVIYLQRNVSHWMPVPAAPVTKKGE
jgi:hypothetical protein